MAPQQLLFIFSQPPDNELATAAWDAAMTAGLLNQAVTILFSGDGLKQLTSSDVLDRITSLQELFPLRLCVENAEPSEVDLELENISSSALPAFHTQFQHILSF